MLDAYYISGAAVVVCLALSGFFSGSETALTGTSLPRMLRLAQQGLEAVGVPVEAHVSPGLEHGIDQLGVELGARFLQKVLA